MDIPTIQLTQAEFDALPTSQSTAWEQTRCKAKSSNGQWLYIDKDGNPKAAVIEIVRRRTPPRKDERRFGEWWIDTNLPDSPEVATSGKQMGAYLKEKYGITSTKGTRSMVMHMDGSDWFSWQYEWTFEGKKFVQFTCHKRSPEDAAYWGAE